VASLLRIPHGVRAVGLFFDRALKSCINFILRLYCDTHIGKIVKTPNATILCCFTIPENDNVLKIIGLLSYPVSDIWHRAPYYFGFDEGNKIPIPKEGGTLDFRQWLIITDDSQISIWWEDLIEKGNTNLGTERTFRMYLEKPIREQLLGYERDSWPGPNYGELERYSLQPVFQDYPILLDKNAISQVESQLAPPGFLAKGKLFDLLSHSQTIMIKRHVINDFELHGVWEEKDEPENNGLRPALKGFVQADKTIRSDCEIKIKEEGNGWSKPITIDSETGIWTHYSNQPVYGGEFQVIKKGTTEEVMQGDFNLIKSMKINLGLISAQTNDLFGRNLSKAPLTEKVTLGDSDKSQSSDALKLPKSFIWTQHNYQNHKMAEIALCDLIHPAIEALGPKILIADPYLLGSINIEKHKYNLNAGQRIFYSAILWACSKSEIEELQLLGRKKWLKGVDFKNWIEIFMRMKMFAPNKIIIRETKTIFHERYWSGLRGDATEDIVMQAGHSISGLATSSDFSLRLLRGEEATHASTIQRNRWNNAVDVLAWERPS